MNYALQDNIAVITFDNGKVNAVNPDFMDAMHGYLDKAEEEAGAVVLVGKPGIFSAGYDLKILQADPAAGLAMVNNGLKMLERFYSFPKPLVAACEGHAIGLGAFMLLASDTRIGAEGEYNITLPETAIAMPFGTFLMELATARISAADHTRRILQSIPCTPGEAQAAGFLDTLVPADQVVATAIAAATKLTELPPKFYATNKLDLRKHSLAVMREAMASETLNL